MPEGDSQDLDRSPDSAWTALIADQFAALLGLEDSHERTRQLDRLCTIHPELSDSLHAAYDRAERRRLPPESIGDYRVVSELGRGGMGIVYAAERIDIAQPVAIKCVLPDRRLTPAMLERFDREARLNAALTHPNCVFVYDSGVYADQPFFVMERLPGPDLESLVAERGPLPVGEAIRLALDIVDGLTAAHDIGVLHRDVKPGNCLLTADGRVKVADFGLSKALNSTLALTGENAQLGTLGYASPEQLRGDPLDYRADVFSCGATLYLLLTGRRAFAGNTPGAVLEATFAGRVTDCDPALALPDRVEPWLRRCLSVTPSDRPADLRTMRAELEAMLPEHQEPARPFERIVSFFADVALAWMSTLLLGVLAHLLVPDPWFRTVEFGFALVVNIEWSVWLNHLVILLAGWVPYHTVSTLLLGGSIGQRVVGLEVLKRDSLERPGITRLLTRNLILCGGQFLAAPVFLAMLWSATQLGPFFVDFLSVLSVGSILFAPALFRRWRQSGLHELLSGTRTVFRHPGRHSEERHAEPEPAPKPGSTATLPEFPSHVDVRQFAAIPKCFVATDPALQRRVFLIRNTSGATASDLEANLRATRVRQIGLTRSGSDEYLVLAPPAGTPLQQHLLRGPAGWAWTRQILAQLLDELIASRTNRTLPEQLGIDQLFVGSQARLQFAPWPPGVSELYESATSAGCLRFVARVAQLCITGAAADPGAPARPAPRHASRFIRELADLGSLEEARTRLSDLASHRAEVEPRQRLTSLAGITFLLVFLASTLTAHLANDLKRPIGRAIGHLELRQYDLDQAAPESADHLQLTANVHSLRRAIETHTDRSPILIASGSSRSLNSHLTERVRFLANVRDRAVQGTVNPVDHWPQLLVDDELDSPPQEVDDFAALRQQWLTAERQFARADGDPFELARDAGRRASGRQFRLGIALAVALGCALGAFLSRGGLGLWIAGIVVVGADGRPASRWRAMFRSTSAGAALLLLTALAEFLISAGGVAQFSGETLALTLVCGTMGYPFLHYRAPQREWQDRLAGTHLVPR